MPNLNDKSIPLPLGWLIAHGITSMSPWHFLADQDRIAALRAEYRAETSGGRDCLPFAVRQDCDDVAAFIVSGDTVNESVIDVHLTYSGSPEREGFPSEKKYETFWDWFKDAIDDTADFADEIDLDEILTDGTCYVSGGFNSETRGG